MTYTNGSRAVRPANRQPNIFNICIRFHDQCTRRHQRPNRTQNTQKTSSPLTTNPPSDATISRTIKRKLQCMRKERKKEKKTLPTRHRCRFLFSSIKHANQPRGSRFADFALSLEVRRGGKQFTINIFISSARPAACIASEMVGKERTATVSRNPANQPAPSARITESGCRLAGWLASWHQPKQGKELQRQPHHLGLIYILQVR